VPYRVNAYVFVVAFAVSVLVITLPLSAASLPGVPLPNAS